MRGRALRVDFAQPDIKDLPKDQRGARDRFGLPPLPPGVILPPGVNPAQKVDSTLLGMPPAQMLDVVAQMKVGSGLLDKKHHGWLSTLGRSWDRLAFPLVYSADLACNPFLSISHSLTISPFSFPPVLY